MSLKLHLTINLHSQHIEQCSCWRGLGESLGIDVWDIVDGYELVGVWVGWEEEIDKHNYYNRYTLNASQFISRPSHYTCVCLIKY